jgi:DNA-binding NarL/FixJ family response regulator
LRNACRFIFFLKAKSSNSFFRMARISMTLFIVDDNSRIRRTIRAIVASPSDTVVECSGGDLALELMSKYHPDLVLMDIRMSPVDGITATRAILKKDPGVRVVIVTEYDDSRLREEAERAGAAGYVLKENLLELKNIRLGKQ